MKWGLLAVLLAACNGQLPAMEADDPHPVPDAAPSAPPPRIPDAAVPSAAPSSADAAPESPADAGPALPDGGVGFRIVAGAAIVEAVPARVPEATMRTDRTRPLKAGPPSAAPASTSPAAPLTGAPRLSPMQTIRAHQGDVLDCYGRVALKDPSVRGRITVQWTIGKDGVPMGVAITEDTLKDKSVGACIKDRARAWRFPPPGGGVQVISYPFDLRIQ